MMEKNNKIFSIDLKANHFRANSSNAYIEEFLYPKIKDFLLQSSSIYLNIGNWWEKTVVPGLRTGERICNYVIENNELVALSVGKRSNKSSKLCTLKVNPEFRSQGLGHDLLSKTISQLTGTGCKKVHFTISDEIKEHVGNFFENCGFNLISWKYNRYSTGHEEMVYSAHTKDILCAHQKYRNIATNFSRFLATQYDFTCLKDIAETEDEFDWKTLPFASNRYLWLLVSNVNNKSKDLNKYFNEFPLDTDRIQNQSGRFQKNLLSRNENSFLDTNPFVSPPNDYYSSRSIQKNFRSDISSSSFELKQLTRSAPYSRTYSK